MTQQRRLATAAESPRLEGLPPVVDARTRVLVLGSFPSRASLDAGEYYAHPRNQFWPLLSELFEVDLRAMTYARRLETMLARGLGIWDVYASCQREGSLDRAIVAAQPNDLPALAARLVRLEAMLHNGGESARSLRLTRGLCDVTERLPSTSPANASWSFARKVLAWRAALARHGLCAAV